MIDLPESFVARTRRLLGDDYDRFAQALHAESPVSIRLNPLKCAAIGGGSKPVPWSSWGHYLQVRPAFTFDPRFHAGAYYVQEASSMFLGRVIRQYVDAPVRYLDMCAAPGGKSTDAIASLPEGSLVVSNEVVPNRSYILVENIIKWGSPNCFVTRNEAADFGRLTGYFDVIATDVPCSGEGMFRKDSVAIAEWSPEAVARCADRQRGILTHVWNALRPGGLLIYSTCTYNTEENEEMVRFLQKEFGAKPLPVDVPAEWGIGRSLDEGILAYRFMPHLTPGEGLFMALLQKPGEPDSSQRDVLLETASQPSKKRNKKEASSKVAIPDEWREKLIAPDRFHVTNSGDDIIAIPVEHFPDYQLFSRHFNLLYAGVILATLKGRDYMPHISLALSTSLDLSQVTVCETDLDMALAYLRREGLILPPDLPRGYILVTYQGYPLGWVKNIGNRANNLYPQEWRIRSGYTPDTVAELSLIPRR